MLTHILFTCNVGSSCWISRSRNNYFDKNWRMDCVILVAVQHERGPRNSTIRRQVAMYLKETRDYGAFVAQTPFRPPYLPSCYGLDPMANGVDLGTVTPPSPVSPGILCQPTPKVYNIFVRLRKKLFYKYIHICGLCDDKFQCYKVLWFND